MKYQLQMKSKRWLIEDSRETMAGQQVVVNVQNGPTAEEKQRNLSACYFMP